MEINNELVRSLGMALVHSLWEGLLILVMILFALSLIGRTNAWLRYLVLVSGHFFLLAAFLATWYIMYHHSQASAVKPLTHVYAQVNGLLGKSLITSRTADYTLGLSKFLEPLYPALAVGWIMGFIFMIIRMAGGFYLSFAIMRKEVFLPDTELLALFERAQSKLLMPITLRLRMSSRQISPMVIGILKPVVIVPAAILSGLNTEQMEAILVHELAHIRRYDHVLMILQAIVTQILFFHPVAWYLSAGIDRERENCCDDLVIKTFPNPINYIKALTMIQQLNVDRQVPVNALMGRSKRLLGRVKRLLKTEKRHAPVFRVAAIFLFFISLGIAAITIVSASNPGSKKSFEGFFTVKPAIMKIATDTLKTKKHEKTKVDKESASAEEGKKQKEIDEAKQKLETAQLELQKAQIGLQKAREEFMRAGQMQRQDMAELFDQPDHLLSDDQKKELMMGHRVMLEQQKNRDEQYRLELDAMKEGMRLHQLGQQDWQFKKEDWEKQMKLFKEEDWQRNMKEWEKAGKEMDKNRKEFYKMWKDSAKTWTHPDPVLSMPPVAPELPVAPPPDINMEISEPDMVAPPEPVVPMELMKDD